MKRKLPVFLESVALSLLAAWSAVGCLRSAFQLPMAARQPVLLVWLLWAVLCSTVLFRRWGGALLLALAAVGAAWLWYGGVFGPQTVSLLGTLAKAYDGGYAIGAFNVNNMEIVQGITEACQEEHAPVILQVSKGARAYANHTYLVKLVEAAVATCPDIPIVLHLDHGPDFETCKSCIDGGFTSVMIDASSKPFAENIEITRKVVEYAHDHGVVVEAELGTLAGIEDEVKVAAHEASYTRPEEVEEFVSKTGCDSLAIAIGTSHGAYKFKPEQCTVNEKGILVPPPLRFDVLEEVSKRLPGFPIVLHGSSSVPQEYVKMINEHGGKMPNAIGVPEDQLREAAKLSVCKINIDSDLRLAMTGTIRQFMDEHPDKFDPREYLKPARANIKELVRHKLVDVLGCAGKA